MKYSVYEFNRMVEEHCTGCPHYKALNKSGWHYKFCDFIGDTGHARGGTVFECDRNTGKKEKRKGEAKNADES